MTDMTIDQRQAACAKFMGYFFVKGPFLEDVDYYARRISATKQPPKAIKVCTVSDYRPWENVQQAADLLEKVKAEDIQIKIETAVCYPSKNPWLVHLRQSVLAKPSNIRHCIRKSCGEDDDLKAALTAAVAEMQKEGGK